jgi:spermidine synthase
MGGNWTRRRLAAGAAGLAGAAWAGAAGQALAQRDGQIERRESQYNTIYVSRDGPFVIMQFGVNRTLFTQSRFNPDDPKLLPVEYTRYMTVGLAYAPQTASVLEIGLGGSSTSQYLHAHVPTLSITCVEIDPEVIALAKKYFGLRPDRRLQVVAMDGRLHLNRNRKTYDMILVDAYRGTFVPEHLLSKEFFALAKSRLNPGGVMVQNVEPSTMLYDAAIATIRSVFDHVDVFDAAGNVVVVAYAGAQRTQAAVLANAQALQARHQFRHPLPEMIAERRFVTRAEGRILTDDFNPADMLRATQRGNDRTGR